MDLLLVNGFFGAIYGAFLASVAGALLPRLDRGEKWLGLERSKCEACGKPLPWQALVPIFSYFYQKKRSACCQIELQFPYGRVELLGSLLFAGFGMFFYEHSPSFYIELALWSIFFLLAVQDYLYHYIHEKIVLVGFGILVFAYVGAFWEFQALLLGLQSGAALLFFGLQYALSKGKALGFGDIELGLWMSFILHQGGLEEALVTSYVLASILGLITLFFGFVKPKSHIPLAPFLALGTFLAYYGPNFLLL